MTILSIVTITRNSPSLLENTIKSYPHSSSVEGIVVDGSSSNFVEQNKNICDLHNSHHDCKIKYIKQIDRGQFNAHNLGLISSSGYYVIFMDGGDTFTEDSSFLNDLALCADASVDLILFQSNLLTTCLDYYGLKPLQYPSSNKLYLILCSLFPAIYLPVHQAVAFRRSTHRKIYIPILVLVPMIL